MSTKQRSATKPKRLTETKRHCSQYTSIRFSERLADVGIAASLGTIGDSYDNALAETINGLYKTELIKPRGPWRTVEHVEIATAEWVDWFNHRRLYEHCGDIVGHCGRQRVGPSWHACPNLWRKL